jgi:hypothetical protein
MWLDTDNITLDCQGYSILANQQKSWSAIFSNSSLSNVMIKNCNVSGINTRQWLYHGLHIDALNQSNIKNISISESSRSIWLYNSHYNNLTNLTIYQIGYNCLYFENSSYNDVNDSAFYCGTQDCLEFQSYNSFSNKIYNNKIYAFSIKNTNNASINNWNTTEQNGIRIYGNGTKIGGNYYTNSINTCYSDTCIDSDVDGYCDSPYVIDGNNTDYLPLSDEYSSTSESNTLNISQTICIDQNTLKTYHYYDVNNNSYNYSKSELCAYGCDNITMSCNPPEYQSNIFNIALIIIVIIGIALTYRFARSK